MPSKPTTVREYLDALPPDRRAAISAVRDVVNANVDGYEEGIQYGMIGWYVPHSAFPAGYHCDPKQPLPFAALASQKSHMSLHLMGLYIAPRDAGENPEAKRFREAWAKTGKKLDMGKACVRFKKLDDVALDVIGGAIRRMPAKTYVALYEATLASSRPAAKKKSSAKKPAAKSSKPKSRAK